MQSSINELFQDPYASAATIGSIVVPIISGLYFCSKIDNKNLRFFCCFLSTTFVALFSNYAALNTDHKIFNHISNFLFSVCGFLACYSTPSKNERFINSLYEEALEIKAALIDNYIRNLKPCEHGMAA